MEERDQLAVPGKEKPAYEVSGREQVLILLALALGVLAADLLCSLERGLPGLGVLAGTAAWYGVLFWYLGFQRLKESRTRLFFGTILLLAATFALFSNQWFRFFNLGALLMLMTIHAFQLSGVPCKPWYLPSMLWERLLLLEDGVFGRLGALAAVGGKLRGSNARRVLMVCAGLGVTIPLVLAAAWLLVQADALFRRMTGDIVDWAVQSLGGVALRVVLGLCAAPFLFSLLYALGRPKGLKEKQAGPVPALDQVVPVMALGALDLLYVVFVGVQSAALFGGEAYLRSMGLSYASYARSGFFQLVFVAVLNLTVVLTALQLTRREGRGWQTVQVLGTALAALSGVILASAACRMTLYVTAYGLSFKRVLTYWGMGMIALFLVLACVKVWRKEFSFFKVAAVAALAGWLVLNYANVDRIVCQYNVGQYLSGQVQTLDLYYLSSLSYEALPALERLDGQTPMSEWDDLTLGERLAVRGARAAKVCAQWENWSLSAWLAAGKA